MQLQGPQKGCHLDMSTVELISFVLCFLVPEHQLLCKVEMSGWDLELESTEEFSEP